MENKEKWEEMLNEAVEFQQTMYELLPDWTVLNPNEIEYLKNHIIIAKFGINVVSNVGINEFKKNMGKKQNAEVNEIFEILKEKGKHPNGEIWFGIIYVVTFRCQSDKHNKEGSIHHIPIYTIKNYTMRKNTQLYVDSNCRIYTSWKDYLSTNQLPPCTMVYPQDGRYQPNPAYKVTENYSRAWICYMDSPATNQKITRAVDTAASVAGNVSGVVMIASLFTPVAPLVCAGVLATGVASGGWSVIRSTYSLVDRYKHQQSINITNKTSAVHYLNIAGASMGIAASGGCALISNAAGKGRAIGAMSKIVFNTATRASLVKQGIDVGFHAYCMYEQYQEEGSVDSVNVFGFAISVFFFGNAIVNMTSASDLIKSTQAEVVESYQKTLRDKRFLKSFNRIKHKSLKVANNEADVNGEIIRRLRVIPAKKGILTSISQNTMLRNTSRVNDVMIHHSVLNVDVVDYIKNYTKPVMLHCAAEFIQTYIGSDSNIQFDRETVYTTLQKTVESLLSNMFPKVPNRYGYQSSTYCRSASFVNKFDRILNDMKNINEPVEILTKVFNMGRFLIEASDKSLSILLPDLMEVLWHYIFANVKEHANCIGTALCHDFLRATVLLVINTLLDRIDIIMHTAMNAFRENLHKNTSSTC